jgi:hypothetical protein
MQINAQTSPAAKHYSGGAFKLQMPVLIDLFKYQIYSNLIIHLWNLFGIRKCDRIISVNTLFVSKIGETDMSHYIGIDIGSTCAKTIVMDENK